MLDAVPDEGGVFGLPCSSASHSEHLIASAEESEACRIGLAPGGAAARRLTRWRAPKLPQQPARGVGTAGPDGC